MLSFEHPEFLLYGVPLVLLVVFLYFAVLKWKARTRKQIGDEDLVTALTSEYSPKNFNYKFYFVVVAVAICILAAANLRSPETGSTGNLAGVDVMVAMDVSNSMLAQDIKPNRLERARQLVNKLIDKMGGNRMGLVLFAGDAFLQMPVTSDLAAARLYVSSASPDAVPTQGTEIAQALKLCNTSLDVKEKKYKTVVLITDGETHDDNVADAIKLMQDNGVVVNTIGIGSPEGSPIIDPSTNDYKKDENGTVVISKLDQQDLENIAIQTGGQYFLYSNPDDITLKVMSSIEGMEKKKTGGQGVKVYDSYFQWFVLVTFLLLLLEAIVPERKMKWLSWSKV